MGFPPLRQPPPDSRPQGTSSGTRLSASRSGWAVLLFLKQFKTRQHLDLRVTYSRRSDCIYSLIQRTCSTEQVGRNLQQVANLARPVIHGEVWHLVQTHNHLRVLTVRQLDHRPVLGQTGKREICSLDAAPLHQHPFPNQK